MAGVLRNKLRHPALDNNLFIQHNSQLIRGLHQAVEPLVVGTNGHEDHITPP